MKDNFKTTRAFHNYYIHNLSGFIANGKTDAREAYKSVLRRLELPEDTHIKDLTDMQAGQIYNALKQIKDDMKVIPVPAATKPEDKLSPKKKSSLIAIFNKRYDGDFKKIFAGLNKFAKHVLDRMKPADVNNTYIVAFWETITDSEAHKLIQRFDAASKKQNEKK